MGRTVSETIFYTPIIQTYLDRYFVCMMCKSSWYTIADSELEGSPAAKAEDTCARVSLRGLITYFQEALWGEMFRIGVHCGVVKHVPRVHRKPDYTLRG